jgi:hypothetical protein
MGRQSLDRAAPLKAVERESVKEKRGVSDPTLNVRDSSESYLGVAARGMEGRRVYRRLSAGHGRLFSRARHASGKSGPRQCAGRSFEKLPAMHFDILRLKSSTLSVGGADVRRVAGGQSMTSEVIAFTIYWIVLFLYVLQ